MFTNLKSALALVAVGLLTGSADGFWRINCANIAVGRMDPLVSFGQVAAHVHTVQGASNFGVNATFDSLTQSSCASCEVQDDKSAYWTPLLYYQFANGSFIDVKQSGSVLYYIGRGVNKDIKPFPAGFRMISGDAGARSYDSTTLTYNNKTANIGGRPISDRNSWACLTTTPGKQTPYFNNTDCYAGLRAQIHFQSCWDGVNLYKSDQSHVAYMSQIDNGYCPPTHPVQLMHLFIETSYQVNKVPKEAGGRFVLSNGDTTGYSFHADFQNGWNQTTLERAIPVCAANPGSSGDLNECPPLMESKIDNFNSICPMRAPTINETVQGLLPKLPGCIKVTEGPTRATFSDMNCDASVVRPAILSTPDTVPIKIATPNIGDSWGNDGWTYTGCSIDGSGGRVLDLAMTSAANMTVPMCQTYCANKGYKFAGLELGTQCYCDNYIEDSTSFLNGTVVQNKCYQPCAGDGTQYCGGQARIDVYNLTTVPQMPLPVIQGQSGTYVHKGCYKEPTKGRALANASTTSDSMTPDVCAKFCLGKGLKWFGVEYGRECFCGANINTDPTTGATRLNDTDCSTLCAGNTNTAQTFCGGPSKMNAYYSGTL